MLCNSRRTSAERDTVKSSVADRRLWNLGETRHNGFEGADLGIPEKVSLVQHQQHQSWLFGVSKLGGNDLVWGVVAVVRVCSDG